MTQYAILIYGDESAFADAAPRGVSPRCSTPTQPSRSRSASWAAPARRRRPGAERHGDVHPGRRRDRRPVHRDQGGARRLLPRRRPRPRPRARDRQALPGPVGGVEVPAGRSEATLAPAAAEACDRRRGRQAVAQALADAHRREWAFVLAATVRVTGDLDLAEECAQEAYVDALEAWARDGVPTRPGAWLTTAARRARRRPAPPRRRPCAASCRCSSSPEPTPAALDGADADPRRPSVIPDDRLRLVFTCCHPALAPEAQVALTLRLVCGCRHPRHRPRVPRARGRPWPPGSPGPRRRSPQARIPYRVPTAAELPERLDGVLTVVHLLFSTGHTAPTGDAARARRPVRPGPRPRPHARAAAARRAARPAACWRLLLLTTPGARPAPTPTAGSCCWRSRTARGGTGR